MSQSQAGSERQSATCDRLAMRLRGLAVLSLRRGHATTGWLPDIEFSLARSLHQIAALGELPLSVTDAEVPLREGEIR